MFEWIENKIKELEETLDRLFKRIVGTDRIKCHHDIRCYTSYLENDIEFIQLRVSNESSRFFHISNHLCEISAFMSCISMEMINEYYDELENLRNLFNTVNEAYSNDYRQHYSDGVWPPCYYKWKKEFEKPFPKNVKVEP